MSLSKFGDETTDDDDFGVEKYSEHYFNAVLSKVRKTCERSLKVDKAAKEAFVEACNTYYDGWYSKVENEQWLTDLLENKASKEEIEEAQTYVDESNEWEPKNFKFATKKAMQIFGVLDEELITKLEANLVKGAIVAQATPKGLAQFASKSRQHEKYIKRLFQDPILMKDMLRHGGAEKCKYGSAMKIYCQCLGLDQDDNSDSESDEDLDSGWKRVNSKIALAVALELCAPTRHFDSADEIDPVERYKHFEKAHRKGELDPAFPHFSVWEMRQIVNCDAPNDQMKWCRDMVMNYQPHLTCLTNEALRYTYILESDVRMRKPTWTASPRTYPMILSGGGNETVNSWFGRFILKSFGLPSWGTQFRRKEGFTRWTPNGWEALNGADWDNCTWKGKTGKGMKMEIESRCKAPPEEYFKKLISLKCLADFVDGVAPSTIPEEEKDVLHPERMWRSVSIISMSLLFETKAEVVRTFERKGPGLVITNCEKYLEKYEIDAEDNLIAVDTNGVVTIPASRHGYESGNILAIESFGPGKQLNFMAGGQVEYEFPDDATGGKYIMTCDVCTVSAKQSPLTCKIDNPKDSVNVNIPYTIGEWQITEGVQVEVSPGAALRMIRGVGSLGLAVKKYTFTPVEPGKPAA